jgi:hypothetical protein
MEKIGGRRVGTRLNGVGRDNVVFQIDLGSWGAANTKIS